MLFIYFILEILLMDASKIVQSTQQMLSLDTYMAFDGVGVTICSMIQ